MKLTSGLYDAQFEHDACGIGFVAHVKGRKSHQIISDAHYYFRKFRS
jgi:glutamate synthase (NADPH/NADH) large chain